MATVRKPSWRRDWAGFSGGWYGKRIGDFELTVLGIYHFGYSVDIGGPLIGDVRIGYRTKRGRENPYRHPLDKGRMFYVYRRSNAQMREAEAEAEARERRIIARRRPPSWDGD